MNFDQPHHITLKAPLIVAVSGGLDSMALLHKLHHQGFSRLIVAHVDHSLRKNSANDREFVRSAAKRYGSAFATKKVDIAQLAQRHKLNIEDVGRNERYKFFRSLQKKYRAAYIVTAHHADDQVETVLLNIIRGCGIDGLAGMTVIDADLWRPLIHNGKKELQKYCKSHRLDYVEDETNADLRLRRNFLRKKIIPQLQKINPQLTKTMGANVELWSKIKDYGEQQATKFLKEHLLKPYRYDLKAFLAVPDYEQQLILRALFEAEHGHKKNLQQSHLNQVLNILRNPTSGKKKEFGAGKMLIKQRTWFEVQSL